MSLQAIANNIHTAESLDAISFYTTESDQWKTTLHCRTMNLPALTKEQHALLVLELNAAIAPITARWSKIVCNKAGVLLAVHQEANASPANE